MTSPELRVLESRQLKICATCFEIAVCLMRILEMIVSKVPEVFLDISMPSSELLLKRLIQVSLVLETTNIEMLALFPFNW